MHATQLLDTHLKKHCQGVHKRRMTALMTMTHTLLTGKKLSVTGLGRAIKNETKTKHNIKRADRLIGNAAVNQDRIVVNRAMAKLIIGQQRRPVIINLYKTRMQIEEAFRDIKNKSGNAIIRPIRSNMKSCYPHFFWDLRL